MRSVVAACVMAAVSLAAVPAGAQETINYASVSGRVTDPSGTAVAGAEVTARLDGTRVTSTARTDQEGRFRFPYLRVGAYEIAVHAPGFSTATRQLSLAVGSAFDLPIALAVGTVEETVTVTAESPALETARSQIASTLPQTEISAAPLNGRNFLDLALLVPGVSLTNIGGGTQQFPETSAVPGVGLSIGSQRNLSNSFIVDGLSANDDAAALSGIPFGVDTIDQFQVVTSGGQAELGRALGGYVNVVTRSGTNVFRGDGYGFFRDDRLNAANALSGTKLPMHQNQFGASSGGAIRRDRTFFFGNVETRRLSQSGLVTISDASTATINARLAAVGYRGPGVQTGIYSNPVNTTYGLAKIDHHRSQGDYFSLRYNAYRLNSENARNSGGTVAPSASTGLENRDQTVAFGSVHALSPRTVLETRAQFAYSYLKAPPTDPIGPGVSISGVAAFGTSSGNPTARANKMVEVVSNLSHQAGAHAIRGGVDVLYNDLDITYPRSIRGSYSFSSLANFLAGTYTNSGFSQTFGDVGVSLGNPNIGIYVQDEWRASHRLTLNAGLRYDLQSLEAVETDRNNLSPRLGAVWAIDADQRSLVRASGGRFYDRVPLRAVANALLSAGNTTDLAKLRQIGVSLSPNQTGAPAFPNILSTVVPTTTLVNFTTMDPNMQNARSDQVSVEYERRIGRSSTMSVTYQYLRGEQLIMSINQNVPSCAASAGNNGCRPVAAYADNRQYRSAGSSNYHGVHLSFLQRPTRWGSYRVSYALSKSMNNVGEAFFNAPIDPFDLSKDWGRSDDDQRHRLVAMGTIDTKVLVLTSVVQYSSALPFNITSGANTIQGTPGRPVVNGEFIPRNSGEGSAFSTVSLRVSRLVSAGPRVKIEGMVELFNLFNRRNDIARIGVFGSGAYPTSPAPNFGQVTVVGDPRSVQLGFRARF